MSSQTEKGSINSIVIVFFGLQAGKILLHYPDDRNRLIRFGIWGGKFLICRWLGAKELICNAFKLPRLN